MVNHRVSYVKDIAGYGQPYLPGQLSYTTKVEPFAGQRNCSFSVSSHYSMIKFVRGLLDSVYVGPVTDICLLAETICHSYAGLNNKP